jgi:heat shock protein HtpX
MARQRAAFGRDPGLQARMLLTMFLLGALYVVFIGVLLAAGAGVVTMVIVIGALSLAQLFLSDKLAMSAMGAKEVTPEEAPGLHAMIERLCIQADLPKPKIAVADMQVPNAFAMGRSKKNATVCATTGIMRVLSPAELEGVMAHELAHVKNRDILISSVAATLAAVIMFAAHTAQFAAMFGGYGGRGDGRDRGNNPIALLAMIILAPLAATVIQMAISRSREFSADATGAQIAGTPYGLADALRKIEAVARRVPLDANPATAHMFIVKPFSGAGLASLFSSHPPTEQRIAALLGGIR